MLKMLVNDQGHTVVVTTEEEALWISRGFTREFSPTDSAEGTLADDSLPSPETDEEEL